jgi:glutamate synthase (NADPH/NADH) small chain
VDTSLTAPDLFEELAPPLDDRQALVEADRCLDCGGPYAPPPCVVACPADVDVPAFIAALACGRPDDAADVIFAENLLGGTCARVCPTELLCEGACVLPHDGQHPIRIAQLQRYAVEHALLRRRPLRPRVRPNGYRVAVIGAGPAGLVCAGELAARGYAVKVFDERDEVGGLARFAIAPYRQLCQPLPAEAQALADLGVHFFHGFPIDAEALSVLERENDAIVLAVGMGPDADVHYPGEELIGVWDSLPFVESLKTDRLPRVGRNAVVIGGGNTAIDCAREALRLGAARVTLVYRRTEAEMPAYRHEVEEARAEGVQFEWLADPVRFLGAGRVTAVECRRMRLGAADSSGRPRPEPQPGSEFILPADTVVKAIGQRARAEFLSKIHDLALEGGRLRVDPETGATGNPIYFAAGDVTNGGATVVEAVRQAKVAADGVDAFLQVAS